MPLSATGLGGGAASLFRNSGGGALYPFTSAYFTVSRSIANDTNGSNTGAHRYGPTQSQVRSWLSGSSNGGGSHSWANTYVDCPTQGYQRWTIPVTGEYKIIAKSGGGGRTENSTDIPGVKVTANFDLVAGEQLILVAGQGVPRYLGDHCNGGAGASWVMSGGNKATCVPLIVAAGSGGDTSDGGQKANPNTSFGFSGSSYTITPTAGEGGGPSVTGKLTEPIYGSSNSTDFGRGSQNSSQPNSGGWLSDGNDASATNNGGHSFRNDLVGGTRNNSTAGDGGFGGGSGGYDEYGNAGGGFSGAYGQDNSNQTGCGASFVNDNNKGNVSISLANATNGVFQDSNFTSENQMNGWVYVEFIG